MSLPWSGHPLAAEVDSALAVVRQASGLCREVQAAIGDGALQKQDRSPVTVADYGSQALICRALGAAYPADPIIGEETAELLRRRDNASLLERVVGHVRTAGVAADGAAVCDWIDRGSAQSTSDRFWTLDPIDGTKGFLRGQQYAISLALVLDGQLAAAVVGCPNLGRRFPGDHHGGTAFVALRGRGAWQAPLAMDGGPVPVRVSDESRPARVRFCESVEAAHSSHDDTARLAAHLDIAAEPVRLDSQTKYGIVARGDAEAYLRLPRDEVYREKIWDHAGGALVVSEAGGRVSDIAGRALDFSRGHLLADNRGVIVTNGRLHDTILAALADLKIS